MLDSSQIKAILEQEVKGAEFRVDIVCGGFSLSGSLGKTMLLPIYIGTEEATTKIITAISKSMGDSMSRYEEAKNQSMLSAVSDGLIKGVSDGH